MIKAQLNVLGEKLETCSLDPVTGWYRDGCCNTDENDHGTHTVCAKVNLDFLNFCKVNGNDLVTPRPEYNFGGLKDGDCWCVCAMWFKKAVEAGHPCKIFIKSTNKKTLEIVDLEVLKKFAIDLV
jgi:uncharacterized protein (DUF2237 family)